MSGHHWQIMIGVTTDGVPLVGAAEIRDAERRGVLGEVERIWPSQLKNRCVAHTARTLFDRDGVDEWKIMTNRRAAAKRERGTVDTIKRFPRADGSLSIRRKGKDT